MKTLIFICILAVVAADLNAQIEKTSKVLEPAVLECRYQCIQKLDTLGVTSVTDTMILRIGKNISQFYACSTFYLFPGRLPARLSGLGADNRRQLRLTGFQQSGKLFNDRLTGGKRQPRPGRERLAGSRDRLGNLPGIRRLALPDNLQVNRILFTETWPTAGPPLAVNPQTHAVFSSGIRRTMRTWSPA